ncbi:hypothetical protein [Devosia sp.]|uniref:hypothetical protein n=1 Tax=Devosia sp. TaxID=1871048 RepID=UPI001AD5603B|nr:hypothetical protein [Devosia sp.]MBN9335359.1 hypothetical protein [Devosia sp.]
MDDKPSADTSPKADVAVEPDMRADVRERTVAGITERVPRRRRSMRMGTVLGGVAAIVGLAELAASAWVYADMQREMLRVSTELAQLRLSLELYVQRDAKPAAAASASPDLSALENRLAILEQNWRGGAGVTQLPAVPPSGAPAVAAKSDGDCLPSGMRLLVAAGDSYPVCGTETTIEVMNVSNGYISLTDGTTVPSGSTVPLPGTSCMIAVTSGGDEATTGFAEIRVTC